MRVWFVAAALVAVIATIAASTAVAFHMHPPPLSRNGGGGVRNKLLARDGNGPTIAAAWLDAHTSLFPVIKTWMNTFLVKYMTGYTKPAMNFNPAGDIVVNLTDIVVQQFSCDNCVDISLADGHAVITLSNFALALTFNYEAHWHFLHGSGTCKPQTSGLNAAASMAFGPPSWNNTPTVDVSVSSFTVNAVSLNCNGWIGRIGDVLTVIIKHLMGSIFDHEVSKVLARQINAELSNLSLSYTFDKSAFQADFNLVAQKTLIDASRIQIGVAGVFVPASMPFINFPFAAPSSSVVDGCTDGMVSMLLSTYTLNTLGYSAYVMGKLSGTLDNVVTAKDLLLIIPGFALKCGEAQPLSVHVYGHWPVFAINDQRNALTVTVPLNVSITGCGSSIYTMGVTGVAGASITVPPANGAGVSVAVQFSNMSLSNAKEIGSNVGKSALPLLVNLLDYLMSGALAFLNKELAKHPIPLPAIDGFQVTAASVTYASDAVCVQANVANV